MRVAESFGRLSPSARRVVRLLAQLPGKMPDRDVRDEVRSFLTTCLECGVDPVGVERARAVLASYEGVLGGESGEGVRVIA